MPAGRGTSARVARLGLLGSVLALSLTALAVVSSPVLATETRDPLSEAFSSILIHPPKSQREISRPAVISFNKHEKLAHMYITFKAFQLFNARYPGSELSRYIGDYIPNQPPQHLESTVIEGSYDEDIAHENPWDDLVPVVKHFWNWRGGYYAGLYGADSSVDRAHKYFSGGYGIEGKYDTDWSQNTGIRRGVRDHGIIYLYRQGNKAQAYWYLGHAAHLLEDLTVPAHEHLWPHADPGSDAYETYMATNYPRWDSMPTNAIEVFPTLYQIFLETAKVSEQFDAGFGGGENEGIDGTVDKGERRKGGFTPKKLDEEADVLMPLAFEKVASLFRYFYKVVDEEPPRIELHLRRSGHTVVLTADASAISGIDRLGYRFEYAELKPNQAIAWNPIQPGPTISTVRYTPNPEVAYAFRVKCESGAGRIGISAPTYFSTQLLAAR